MARPELVDLQKDLGGKLSWNDFKCFALALGEPLEKLRKHEEDQSSTDTRILHSLGDWLDRDVEASWTKVISALETIDKNVLAKELSSKYCPEPSSTPSNSSTQTVSHMADIAPAPASSDETQKTVTDEAEELSNRFVSVLTKAKIQLFKKECESKSFLLEFRTFLTTLPLSSKHEHMLFLKKKKAKIKAAKDIDEIFDILEEHLNYVNYALLKHVVVHFCDEIINKDMKEYINDLETFEKKTTINDVRNVASKWKVPNGYKAVVISTDLDSTICTLYDARKKKEAIAHESALMPYVIFQSDVHASFVTIVLALPDSALELVAQAMTKEFLKTHHIVSMSIDEKMLEMCDAGAVGGTNVAACMEQELDEDEMACKPVFVDGSPHLSHAKEYCARSDEELAKSSAHDIKQRKRKHSPRQYRKESLVKLAHIEDEILGDEQLVKNVLCVKPKPSCKQWKSIRRIARKEEETLDNIQKHPHLRLRQYKMAISSNSSYFETSNSAQFSPDIDDPVAQCYPPVKFSTPEDDINNWMEWKWTRYILLASPLIVMGGLILAHYLLRSKK